MSIIVDINKLILEYLNIQSNIFSIYILTKLECLLLLLTIDIILLVFYELNNKAYNLIKYKLLSKPYLLIYVYKLYLYIKYILNKIRPKFIHRSYKIDNKIYYHLYRENFLIGIAKFFYSWINLKSITTYYAILVTFLYLDFPYVAIELFKLNESTKDLGINELAALASFVIVILIGVLSIYYNTVSGRIRRGIGRNNQKMLEQSIEYHRRLSSYLPTIIYKGTANLDYFIRNKYNFKKIVLNNISPCIDDVEDGEVLWKKNNKYNPVNDYFRNILDEIKEIDKLEKLFNEINSAECLNFMRVIGYSEVGKSILNVFFLYSKDNFDSLRFKLIVPNTIISLVKINRDEDFFQDIKKDKPSSEKLKYYEDQILEEINNFEFFYNTYLIEAIEILVEMTEYTKAISRSMSLRSYKYSRLFSTLTARE